MLVFEELLSSEQWDTLQLHRSTVNQARLAWPLAGLFC